MVGLRAATWVGAYIFRYLGWGVYFSRLVDMDQEGPVAGSGSLEVRGARTGCMERGKVVGDTGTRTCHVAVWAIFSLERAASTFKACVHLGIVEAQGNLKARPLYIKFTYIYLEEKTPIHHSAVY